jgi:thiosulfate reductase cytochrome b subunit
MTAETISIVPADATIHPGWVRVCHWINALAILLMIGSGWQIYDASPLFRSLEFSKHIALGTRAKTVLWERYGNERSVLTFGC